MTELPCTMCLLEYRLRLLLRPVVIFGTLVVIGTFHFAIDPEDQ